MSTILDGLGEDMAALVSREGLPLLPLDIDKPRVKGLKVFDYLLRSLYGRMNSLFLVHDDVEFSKAYINSLALLMGDTDKFAETIHRCLKNMANIYDLDISIEQRMIDQLVGKRLYMIYLERMLALVGYGDTIQSENAWNNILTGLVNESRNRGYFLIIENLHYFFKKENLDKFKYPAFYLFHATGGNSQLTLITPLSWINYYYDIEYGILPRMTHQCKSILFSPRPSGFLGSPPLELSPDVYHDFDIRD